MSITEETVSFTRNRKRLPINAYTLGNKKRLNRMTVKLEDSTMCELEGIDFLDLMKDLSTDPAIHLIADLIQAKNATTNLAPYDTSTLSPSEKNRVSKGYKDLEERGIIVRVQRGIYLVNPRLSPPYPDYFDSVCLHWTRITGRQP